MVARSYKIPYEVNEIHTMNAVVGNNDSLYLKVLKIKSALESRQFGYLVCEGNSNPSENIVLTVLIPEVHACIM